MEFATYFFIIPVEIKKINAMHTGITTHFSCHTKMQQIFFSTGWERSKKSHHVENSI